MSDTPPRVVTKIIVSARRDGFDQQVDLEVPAELPSGRLAELIAPGLAWAPRGASGLHNCMVEAHPPGRVLRRDESLADAGAWDGSMIILRIAAPGSPPPQPKGSPVVGWRKLDISSAATAPDRS